MATLVTRSGKGSPLTHDEVDANFNNLNTDKVESLSDLGVTATATELNYVDGVTSSIQTQLDSISVTLGTLTKSFASDETSSIALSASVSPTPVVAVTKEVPQTGVSSKGGWDVDATASNYELYNEAPATSLSLSSTSADGTATLGTGSFSSSDLGKRIFVDDGGEAIIKATDGSYNLVSAFGASSYTSGNWSLSGLDVDATNGITLSEVVFDTWDLSAASFLGSFDPSAQEGFPSGIFFSPDGLKMYVVGLVGDDVNEYDLSTAWDISTASYVQNFSVAGQDTVPSAVFFKPDGTQMYICGNAGSDLNEYSLSTAWDVSTASYVRSLSGIIAPLGIFFKSDGLQAYATDNSLDAVREYSLSTAWNISTMSHVRNFSVSAQETTPTGVFFKSDGTKMFVTGLTSDNVNEYDLSTAWNISSASYSQNFSVSSEENSPRDLFFKPDGTRMYVIGSGGGDVNEYDVTAKSQPTAQYLPALTSSAGQINSQYWTDINSMTADDADNDGEVYYAVSTDDRTTWSIAKASDGVRNIVRNNGGTWQYNSNATYGSTTWTNATTNDEFASIAQAMTVAANQMNKTQLDAVTDGSHFTLGDTLDLAIVPYLASAGTAPTSDGVSINYDAAAINKGAVLGTDYDYDFPEADVVRITSLAAQNLKVRVV